MKIPCLVVNEGSHAWWSMKDPMLGGQWEEKKKVPCYLFPLPLEQLYLNLHFILFLSFDLKFLLYHGPRPSFTPPLPFLGLNHDRKT